MNEKNIIFDQFSRYQACADLLAQVGIANNSSILDIGCGPERLFRNFVPGAKMSFVDPLIPESSSPESISGDIFSSQLNGEKFDCVCAIDVLEHVPPLQRKKFIERISSLASDVVILAFPTSDTKTAAEIDASVEKQYREVYNKDYSWLEEHFRYGLPSADETVELLEGMGWHCQSIGHGYGPWLDELLGFVVNVWGLPGLNDVVLNASERFNKELYQFDYGEPCYRQFVIASRKEMQSVSAPGQAENNSLAETVFREIMDEARKQYFALSMQILSGQEKKQHAQIFIDRDTAIAERDAIKSELSNSTALLEQIKGSLSWRITKPFRFSLRLIQHGLLKEDSQRIAGTLRKHYHNLPLPEKSKRVLSFTYHKIFSSFVRSIKSVILRSTKFHAPKLKPSIQEPGIQDYIVWGVVDWNFRHQRPQQIAKSLVNTGRRVFYVSPILVDDLKPGFEVEPLDESAMLFQIRLFAKGAPSIYAGAPGMDSITQLKGSIGELLSWANCNQTVSLVQHPFWYDVASVLPNSRLVYDCMDHHEGFENTGESLLQLEKALFNKADLTIVTSAWLDEAVADHIKRSAIIRNAGEYDHFSTAPESVYKDANGRSIIGYYGAIAEWFDQDLVELVANRFPECCILLVGADTSKAALKLGKLSNVTFIGEVNYEKLPYYLHSFDLCLLPFKVIPLTLATNPVKVYEYLSAGKPVISVDLPEMRQFNELLYVASDYQGFLNSIENSLNQSDPDIVKQQRKDFAAGQTWVHRGKEIIDQVELSDQDPSVSVVVVTYNNIDLTKACLTSIDEQSQYENLEVIVVDNASSDGSPEFLESWVSSGSNRRLILNEDNRGFSAANNQGLNTATGDYLVMLNNDTYVTPGWLRTLIGHLKRDESIGLIGPVTNNIGNEAKININYETMDEMLINSADYTRQHIGQIYPLRTAAFFCVMMERKVFEKVGLLDEDFGRGFFEDDDYCRRVEKIGFRIVCAEDVFVHHNLSASFNKLGDKRKKELFDTNKAVYEKKWGEWLPHRQRS